jgi:hypothetical protein
VQEYAVCELPAGADRGGAVDKQGSPSASGAGRLRVHLAWNTGGLPLRAQQPVNATITVTDENGKLFTQLEPVMGTYSHLVAFHEDHKTVLHIHPVGAEPQKQRTAGDQSSPFGSGHRSPVFTGSMSRYRWMGGNGSRRLH